MNKILEHIHIVRKLDSHNDRQSQMMCKCVIEWAIAACIPYTIDGEDGKVPNTRVLFVAIGGDGTMLYTMKESLRRGMSAVVGVNTGHLGFLVEDFHAKFEVENFLDDVFDNETILDERMALTADKANGELAVNEYLFSTGTHNAPFNYKVLINGLVVAEQFGSGVLVATSTGSTAMSLSAGGAIVSPSTNIMQIVPIVSHSLSARPIITTGRDKISIETTANDRVNNFELRADGRKVWENFPSNNETYRINIHKYPKQVFIHRPKEWNFFDVLTQKLGW